MSHFVMDQRVKTEYGEGKVTYVSDRSVGVTLDNGEPLNFGRGTFGFDRLVKANPIDQLKGA